jgi:uncharacterized protein
VTSAALLVLSAAPTGAGLAGTLSAVAAVGGRRRRVLVLDGEPGPRVPAGFEVIPQRGDGPDARLANAFADVGVPAVLVRTGAPQVTGALLEAACGALEGSRTDAVLGLVQDGGYWLIGLSRLDPDVFADGGADTLDPARLEALGLSVAAMPALRGAESLRSPT